MVKYINAGSHNDKNYRWQKDNRSWGAVRLANDYDIYSNLVELSNALSKNSYIVDVDFDINDIVEDWRTKSLIVLVQYDIDLPGMDWFTARDELCQFVINTAKQFNLHKTEDRIEDMGTWLYFVFSGAEKGMYIPNYF